ncbi:MAG: hypothetical protein P8X63_04385 [Desulfuromonadaceae bacterium]
MIKTIFVRGLTLVAILSVLTPNILLGSDSSTDVRQITNDKVVQHHSGSSAAVYLTSAILTLSLVCQLGMKDDAELIFGPLYFIGAGVNTNLYFNELKDPVSLVIIPSCLVLSAYNYLVLTDEDLPNEKVAQDNVIGLLLFSGVLI